MVRETKTAALGTNLAEHRRQGNQHPVALFTILLTLNAPACHQHGFILGKDFRQNFHLLRRNAANFLGPGRIFRRVVVFTRQIRFEFAIASGVFIEEGFIMQSFFYQRGRNT
ncbi:hypothetical protein SDC9_197716 [bioreactor metagenome]|uniref:Uncharacterized protein n=1 Tax=bioreactor metagenome TaxID=1076179 RepID=A0A645IG52_9ZZZZ